MESSEGVDILNKKEKKKLFGERRVVGNLHRFIPAKKELCTPPVCTNRAFLWTSLRGGVLQGHVLGPSSVRQIKGCICLYCAAKSQPPLTADTSHVDEEEGGV